MINLNINFRAEVSFSQLLILLALDSGTQKPELHAAEMSCSYKLQLKSAAAKLPDKMLQVVLQTSPLLIRGALPALLSIRYYIHLCEEVLVRLKMLLSV